MTENKLKANLDHNSKNINERSEVSTEREKKWLKLPL